MGIGENKQLEQGDSHLKVWKKGFFLNRIKLIHFFRVFFIIKWENTSLWIFCYSQNLILPRILYTRLLFCHQSGRIGLVLSKVDVHTVHNVICSR